MTDQFSITLTLAELQVIDAALAETPYRIAAPVIQRINQQLQEQPNATGEVP